MHTNYRKDAERSIGQDLSGPGGSANFIDIDIGMDMMTKVERRSSYRQPGKIISWYIYCNSFLLSTELLICTTFFPRLVAELPRTWQCFWRSGALFVVLVRNSEERFGH